MRRTGRTDAVRRGGGGVGAYTHGGGPGWVGASGLQAYVRFGGAWESGRLRLLRSIAGFHMVAEGNGVAAGCRVSPTALGSPPVLGLSGYSNMPARNMSDGEARNEPRELASVDESSCLLGSCGAFSTRLILHRTWQCLRCARRGIPQVWGVSATRRGLYPPGAEFARVPGVTGALSSECQRRGAARECSAGMGAGARRRYRGGARSAQGGMGSQQHRLLRGVGCCPLPPPVVGNG